MESGPSGTRLTLMFSDFYKCVHKYLPEYKKVGNLKPYKTETLTSSWLQCYNCDTTDRKSNKMVHVLYV